MTFPRVGAAADCVPSQNPRWHRRIFAVMMIDEGMIGGVITLIITAG